MMTDLQPQHGGSSLAIRTLTAIVSTLVLAVTIIVVILDLPAGIIRSVQGPIASLQSVEVVPAEPDRTLVCMGAAISLSAQGASALSYGPASDVVAGLAPSLGALVATDLQDGFSLEETSSPDLPSIVSQPVEEGALAATSHQILDNPNVRGLAMAECSLPTTESWLVGGQTTIGRQTALSLSNPGEVSATVNVEIYGAQGLIESPLGQGILVAPGSQRVLSLAGLAPDEAAPVVRVTTNGAPIVASLHYSIVRGLDADGLAVITAQTQPSELRVIPGLYSPPEEVLGPLRGKDGYSDVVPLLRVLAPDSPATVTIRVLRPSLGDVTTLLELEAGEAGDLSLDELGSGDFGVVIESTQPVVAAVRVTVGNDLRTDTSWVGSSPAITGDSLFAVPDLSDMKVSIVNPHSTSVSVTLDGRETSIPGGSVIARPLSPGSHSLSSLEPVYAVVISRSDALLGHAHVLPTPAPQRSVFITPR